ncbi:hypothetical protein [Thiogranum longum]|jgi:uncharacterized protein (DUF486 family)
MRYEETAQLENPRSSVSTDMMVGTALYTLAIGVFFVVFGLRKRQRWIVFWGATMVVAGAAYVVAIALGVDK